MKKAWEREDEVAQREVVFHGLAKSKATVRSDLLSDCPRFSTAARAEEQPAWEKRRTLWASELHGAKGKTQARNGMHGPSLRLGLVMDRGSFKCPGGHCVLVLAGRLRQSFGACGCGSRTFLGGLAPHLPMNHAGDSTTAPGVEAGMHFE
jgi:hypothetical protein